MIEQSDNFTVRLLQEMRAEIGGQFAEMRAQIGVLAKGQVDVRTELKEVRGEIKDVRAEMARMTNHMHEIAIALDGHSARLDRIEQHFGLDTSKH